jgi:Domain of unknown function (DUF2715)
MEKGTILILFLFLSTQAAFFDNGKNEIGGSLAIYRYGMPYYSLDVYQLSVNYNFYFNKSIGLGPIVSFYKNSLASFGSTYECDIGIETTIGIQMKNSFLFFSPGISFEENPYRNFDPRTNEFTKSDQIGFGIPINLGIKTIITGHLGFEGSIKYEGIIEKDQYFDDLGIVIGLFGQF